MVIRGIVFDLDATLVNLGGFVDWSEGRRLVIETYLESGCPSHLLESCRDQNLFDMLNSVGDRLFSTLPLTEAEVIQQQAYSALEACEIDGVSQCHMMPKCSEGLDWLIQKGVKMAIATSNSTKVAVQIARNLDLERYFAIILGRSAKMPMKPHPDQILSCLEGLGVCLYQGAVVGDSARDIAAAKHAGVYAVGVPAAFTRVQALTLAGADLILADLGQLPRSLSPLVGHDMPC